MNKALSEIPSSQVKHLSNPKDIFTVCPQNIVGDSLCYAGIQWNSIDVESKVYNYTIRGNSGWDSVNVQNTKGSTDTHVLPIQWAIDSAIAGFDASIKPLSIPYTSITQDENIKRRDQNFMRSFMNGLGPGLYIPLLGLVYHMTGSIALEREVGLTNLMYSMGVFQSSRVLGFMSSFGALYFLSWVVCGVLYSVLFFKHSNFFPAFIFMIMSGLATLSWSMALSVPFKVSQLAGMLSSVFSYLLALMVTVQNQAGSGHNDPTTVYGLSIFFPPMSHVYFLQCMAKYEYEYLPINLIKQEPNGKVIPIVPFIAPIFQFFFYLALAVVIESLVYGKTRRRNVNSYSQNNIELVNVNKEYKPFKLKKDSASIVNAVNNLSLSISQNQIFCLLGSNGSGKTTTLEMISGIQRPTSGEIIYSQDAKIGICPQKNVLWDNLTVEQHIRLWAFLKRVPAKDVEEYVEFFIDRCGLCSKIKTKAKNLSGGQKRRLQLAIMLVGDSNVCCIDEVSSGVDPVSRRRIWDILLSFRSTHTIILTTHFLDEAELLADNIAILSKGVLQAEGTPTDLKTRFGNGYQIRIDHSGTGSEEVYYYPDSAAVSRVLPEIESKTGMFEITGPSLEDAFLKLVSQDHKEYSFDNYKLTKRNQQNGRVDTLEQGNTDLLNGEYFFDFNLFVHLLTII